MPTMMINILFLIVGFFMLVRGADIFVDGSAALAKNFKVSSLIIGLTIVACGTSAPELAVSTTASLQGSSEIAISNVLGSNTFNLLGILGICSMIFPLSMSDNIRRRDFPYSLITTTILFLAIGGGLIALSNHFIGRDMSFKVATISRAMGVVMIIAYVLYVLYIIFREKKNQSQVDDIRTIPIRKCVLLIVVGLVLIIVGGNWVVDNAKEIALALGLTETLTGFTIVAIGTSLPELATSFVATRKGQIELAIGNVIGSNIFNMLLILGLSAAINPVAVNLAAIYDLLIVILATILTLVLGLTNKRISRVEGGIMVGLYMLIVIYAIIR